MRTINIRKNRSIGEGQPVYVIAEIGINHNGSLENAKKLISEAAVAGCDAVKFQKRTPELCVPEDQWYIERDTPWGRIPYIEYRRKVEFSKEDYEAIDMQCRIKGIEWFASCWDEEAVDFMEQFNPPLYKLASASLTDHSLINKVKSTGRPFMLSTGMSTMEHITKAVEMFNSDNLMIAHSTSAYPCNVKELNLKMIHTLKALYPEIPIGYSGHETGLATTIAAVALGACFVERHFTLDRASWGSDHAASVEPQGMQRLVRDIRDIELALGDGKKRLYESEIGAMKKLRKENHSEGSIVK
jgi:N-acetylneuraminate synthase